MKKNSEIKKNCLLLLEDGSIFFGIGYGNRGNYLGELCFNTSITGYQEILTDPSYFNQIITFTFPHIGIVGTNKHDYESSRMFASGCIINNSITKASNFRSELDFEHWLKENKKACITGVDTRALTKKIRESGSLNGLIHFPKKKFENLNNLKKYLKSFPNMKGQDLASIVSTKKKYAFNKSLNKENNGSKKRFIAVIDFGIKKKILKLLKLTGYEVVVFPANSSINEILSHKPVGFFLSNGPGDPKATFKKLEKNLSILKNKDIPIFGICLGHQILSLLFGAKTIKMHHGHRGANHPIKNVKSKKVEITVQNHGFVVSKNKLPKNLIATHISLFDGTLAGIKVDKKPFFSVQYHPEASPGPQDSRYLFEKFKEFIDIYAQKK